MDRLQETLRLGTAEIALRDGAFRLLIFRVGQFQRCGENRLEERVRFHLPELVSLFGELLIVELLVEHA